MSAIATETEFTAHSVEPWQGSLHDIQPGDHWCELYRDDAVHQRGLADFIQRGLEVNHKVLYIFDDCTRPALDSVLSMLRGWQVEVDAALQSGQLRLVEAVNAYMRDAVFSPERMLEIWREQTEQALAEGYAALRATGEPTWARVSYPGWERLAEYEAQLNRFAAGNQAIIFCQYDLRRFPASMLLDVLCTHPAVLVDGVAHRNIYYLRPEELLAANSAECTLRQWIGNLQAHDAVTRERVLLLDRERAAKALAEARERQLESLAAELEQRAVERQFYVRSLIESSIDALATISPEGLITDVNQQMEALTGCARAELIGTPFRQYFADAERAEAGVRLVLEQGKVTDYELTARSRDGRQIPVAYNASTYYNQQQELEGVFAAARDISERKKLEQELREKQLYTRSLIESSIDALATISPEGLITDVNQQMESLTGCARAELIGTPFRQYFADAERAEAGVRLVLERGRVTDYELMACSRDGRQIPVAYNASTYYNQQQELEGVFAAARDISERKRAEESLRLQADQYATMLATSADGFWRFDQNGQLLDVNDAYCRMSGYSREELLTLTIPQIEVMETAAEVADHIRRVTKSGFDRFESQHRAKDGRILDVEVSVSYCQAATQMILFVRDITQRKRAEAEIQAQAALLNLAHDAIAVCDLQNRITFWNPGAEDTYGWRAAEALGKVSRQLLRTRFPIPLQTIEEKLQEEGEWEGELEHVARDGRKIVVASRWSLQRGSAGTPRAILEINRDITDRKLAEQELRRAHDELELRVQQRTAELAAANAELEAFSYSVSHDLRAPLRHMDSFAKLLVEHCGPSADAETVHCLDRIRSGAQRMARLIDDLLNLSRVGRQTMRFESTDLGPLVHAIVRELETGERNLEWKIGPLPTVRCDAALIKQVFDNLLANAVKFTATRDRAVIEVGQTVTDGKPAFYVRDNGIGFDMKYVDKLFAPFQRLHPPEQFPGTGVGLATVKRIISKHSGQVWAEAAPGHGATFYFTLGTGVAEPQVKM